MFALVTVNDDEKVIVNSNAIQTIEGTTLGSLIYFSSDDCMEVRETVECLYDTLRREK